MKQWDTFFYYGKGTVQDENEQDLLQLVKQPEKFMFYNRQFGCSVKYNFPMSIINHSLVAYSIASAIATRNQNVSDGSSGTVDRRIAASQNSISVEDGKNGERNIDVLYFNYTDTAKPSQSKIQVI